MPLAGATNAALELADVTFSMVGLYSAEVRNEVDTFASLPAKLQVTEGYDRFDHARILGPGGGRVLGPPWKRLASPASRITPAPTVRTPSG